MSDYPNDPIYQDDPDDQGYPDYDQPDAYLPADDDTPAREPVTPPRGSGRVTARPPDLPEVPVIYDPPPRRSTEPRASTANPRAPGRQLPPTPTQTGRGSRTGYYPPTPDFAYTDPPTQQRGRGSAGSGTAGGRRKPKDSGFYLPWWSLLVMLVAVGGLAFGSLLVVGNMGRGEALPGGLTPQIIVITATFTVGPPASQTPIPQRASPTAQRALPTIAPTASLPAGNVALGSAVTIVGVGPSGLNVRSGPGKQYNAKFLAYDGQQYTIKDGPQFASDEEWYYIVSVANPNDGGWASRRFLQGK